MSNTRIYLVAACIGGVAQAPRLIEAGTAATARNFATKDMLAVKPASAKEVAKLIASGVKLEIASDTPAEQQALPGTDDGSTGGDGLGSAPDLPSAELEPAAPATVDPESGAPVTTHQAEAETAMREDQPPADDIVDAEVEPSASRRRNRKAVAA